MHPMLEKIFKKKNKKNNSIHLKRHLTVAWHARPGNSLCMQLDSATTNQSNEEGDD